MIYTGFECVLLPENNWQKNQDESYTNNYQNHAGYNFGYKSVYVENVGVLHMEIVILR